MVPPDLETTSALAEGMTAAQLYEAAATISDPDAQVLVTNNSAAATGANKRSNTTLADPGARGLR